MTYTFEKATPDHIVGRIVGDAGEHIAVAVVPSPKTGRLGVLLAVSRAGDQYVTWEYGLNMAETGVYVWWGASFGVAHYESTIAAFDAATASLRERGTMNAKPETYLSADGYPVTVGARFWDDNLRVVKITKVAAHSNSYAGTGETQTWHDTTDGMRDTLSGKMQRWGRLARFFEGKDAQSWPPGTSYPDTVN